MVLSRITTRSLVNQGLFHIQSNQFLSSQFQQQIATGKKISASSDDPLGVTQLLRLQDILRENKQFSDNINSALSELGTTETSFQNLVDITQKAQEIAIQASNGINSANQLTAFANEVDTLIDSAIAAGNTSFAGKDRKSVV